ncbi:hypothetical protein WA026_020575 [Henosepilachna vigintioctopunctata]|uniref:28S ribosomal protein S34, mitochondrial n=1 Tax=Henosepilachna vigintioctopunctata TaxID=420089 RepID=A0AAW1V191_9CUCU
MPYKYIGRTLDHKGKTLWEIIGNLKNCGIGRVIARNMFERYPEPTFMRILEVEAHPSPEKITMDDRRRVKVLVDYTFRAKRLPEPLIIDAISYKADYKLIPKDEEANYCKGNSIPMKLMPKMIELPPLLKELVIRDNIANNEPIDKDNEIEIAYKRGPFANFRPVKENEKPDVEVTLGVGEPITPSLYKGIDLKQSSNVRHNKSQ